MLTAWISHIVAIPQQILGDETTSGFVDGIAAHWYLDSETNDQLLVDAHEAYPEKFLLYTEACEGASTGVDVLLGSWERGEKYSANIIQVRI